MSQTFNFAGVEEAGLSMTSPGTFDIFEIAGMKFGVSTGKQVPEVEVTFNQKPGVTALSSFRKKYFFTEKAMPSFQHLVAKSTGNKLTATVTEEQLTALLKGKKLGLKVTGSVGSNGKGYPDLPFSGFACSTADFAAFKASGFSPAEQELINKAIEAISTSSSSGADNDGPGQQGGGSSSSTAGGTDDLPF